MSEKRGIRCLAVFLPQWYVQDNDLMKHRFGRSTYYFSLSPAKASWFIVICSRSQDFIGVICCSVIGYLDILVLLMVQGDIEKTLLETTKKTLKLKLTTDDFFPLNGM